MIDFNAIPRVEISHSPTALEFAPRLSESLGCHLFFKRDDCTGLAGGGNKARKLEYLIADALALGADTLVTVGGFQSNHARQTAAGAAKFGLGCELVLEDVAGTPKADYYQNGNMLLNQLLGANIHQLSAGDEISNYSEDLLNKLKNSGKKPYFIPMGGSNVIGSLGYVRCAIEIVEQIKNRQALDDRFKIDQIVIASGSAGTQAGLLAGLMSVGQNIPVLGINVSRGTQDQEKLIQPLLEDILSYLDIDPLVPMPAIHTNGDYFGEGYGMSTPKMVAALRRCASLEGVLLDPVYTGKAMAGFIDLIEAGNIPKESNQLFLHTGGSQSLFAYQEVF